MAQCIVCKQFFPPGFTIVTEDKLAKKCIFCEKEIDEITYTVRENGQIKKCTKQEIIEDYKKLINRLMEDNQRIKELVKGDNSV